PDTMYTYIEEDEVLVTCDSFGSHYSCDGVINSKIENKEHYMDALRYYYDCIMGPFKQYVVNAVEKIKDLKIDVICPGHGPVLLEKPMEIVDIYYNWSKDEIIVPKKDVTICYVSAYGYTETIAENIKRGIEENSDYNVVMYDVIKHNMDEILGSIANSQAVLFGTPTINGDALRPIWDVLVSLNPIVHGTKVASAFGSYGWSGEGVPNTIQRLEQLRMKLVDPLIVNFKPSDEDIKSAVDFGKNFIEKTIDNYSFKSSNKKWKCVICSEVFDGNQAPDVCPVCGAKHDQFIEVIVENITFRKDTDESFVVVGNGAAGFYAVDAIRKRNKTCKITMISNETELSYFRPALSDFINQDINKEEFYIADKTWYEENNINLLLGYNVEKINEENNIITLDNIKDLKYDKLILANGSSNFIPHIEGKELEGVYTLRNKKDLDSIKEALNSSKKAVVIGGGLLGLEAAYEIVLKGIDTTIVEAMPNLLSRQLDSEGSEILEASIKKSKVNLMLDSCVERLEGDNHVSRIVFKDGSSIEADIVIFSIGVRSNINIAKGTNIKINRGIVVDKNMKT
ncbi:MAG: FAD-dependent oxidoreductase, partial [Paraclostridium sp.]